jgi:hypothetical protein
VSGAGLRDLMARMGHDSERAAIIYQHRARGADELITTAIDAHIEAEQTRRADGGQGDAGGIRTGGQLHANCTHGPFEQRVHQKPTPKNSAGLDLYVGAGDGNRTRTISLGS